MFLSYTHLEYSHRFPQHKTTTQVINLQHVTWKSYKLGSRRSCCQLWCVLDVFGIVSGARTATLYQRNLHRPYAVTTSPSHQPYRIGLASRLSTTHAISETPTGSKAIKHPLPALEGVKFKWRVNKSESFFRLLHALAVGVVGCLWRKVPGTCSSMVRDSHLPFRCVCVRCWFKHTNNSRQMFRKYFRNFE